MSKSPSLEITPASFREALELLRKASRRPGRPRKYWYLQLRPDFWNTATAEELNFVEREGLRDSRGRRVHCKRLIAARRAQIQVATNLLKRECPCPKCGANTHIADHGDYILHSCVKCEFSEDGRQWNNKLLGLREFIETND